VFNDPHFKVLFKMNNNFFALSKQVGVLCKSKNVRFALAESCTGGMVSTFLTDVPGSSAWFVGGAVTYSNVAKKNILGVDAQVLESNGAVSEAVALEMAKGAIKHFEAEIAVSITGIAGPHGGSLEKPVGTVCFALADRQNGFTAAKTMRFESGRDWIRQSAAKFALEWVIAYLK
jgi:nicotinamide-nucleotide amidase